MAKAPTIKFPRIHAGFYSITFDGELVGYIAKQGDAKEAVWYVYNDNTPDLTLESLRMETAVDESDLFRVSKDFARGFFTAPPVADETEAGDEAGDEAEVETVELQTPEWSEDENTEEGSMDLMDEMSEFEDVVEEEELVVA